MNRFLPFHRRLHTRKRRPAPPRLEVRQLEARNLLSGSPVINVNTDTPVAGGTPAVAHAETTIAVNPTNALNLIGCSNEYTAGGLNLWAELGLPHAHVSFDGGQTWTDYALPFNPNQYTGAADPAVAFDAHGTAYLSLIAVHDVANGNVADPDLLVAHSSNGGKTWSDFVRLAAGSVTLSYFTGAQGAGVENDKDYITAWGHGNAIVTWTQLNWGPGGSLISGVAVASVTHDGGKTWTAPTPLAGTSGNTRGLVPAVAADGSIYVSFVSFNQEVPPQYRDNLQVVKVDPATGQPLGAAVEVGLMYDGFNDNPNNIFGYSTLQDSQFFALNFAAPDDITADPTNPLHLAVVWYDLRNNPYPDAVLPSLDPYQVTTNSDIIVSQSFDGGQTWSAPTAIQEPGDQFMPWGEYDAAGRLQIGYYDRSYDPANHKYGYTLASETAAGSLTFALQQVTTALSDPTQGDAWFATTANSNFPSAPTFLGDYSNIAITPDGVAALWTDMRLQSTVPGQPGWSEDAFFARVRVADTAQGANQGDDTQGDHAAAVRDGPTRRPVAPSEAAPSGDALGGPDAWTAASPTPGPAAHGLGATWLGKAGQLRPASALDRLPAAPGQAVDGLFAGLDRSLFADVLGAALLRSRLR